MILKYFEIKKINLEKTKFILFYGKNEGLKKDSINSILNNGKIALQQYDEKEVLENQSEFIEKIFTKSLFEEKKTLLINRCSDKILKIIDEIVNKNPDDTLIFLNAENLEKKSKLRSFFEKNTKCVCIAFYPDNEQTLSKITFDFLRMKKISISSLNVNLIINKCFGDRGILIKELEKIENYSRNGKKITEESLSKLINLAED